MQWCSWLRHCTISWKIVGSIPDGAIEIFDWHNPFGCTVTLGLIQPLIEMSSQEYCLWGKGSWCVGLTTLPPSCAECLEIWEPQPPGTLRACPGLMGLLYLYKSGVPYYWGKQRPRGFEKRIQWEGVDIWGKKRHEDGRDCMTRSFTICIV